MVAAIVALVLIGAWIGGIPRAFAEEDVDVTGDVVTVVLVALVVLAWIWRPRR